jgi:SAM-dependent methyltransferase
MLMKRRRWISGKAEFLLLIGFIEAPLGEALSPKDPSIGNGLLSRRDLWKVPVGAVATYSYGNLLSNALSFRPQAHEERLQALLGTAFLAGIPPSPVASRVPGEENAYRILEIGIGDCRVIRRGLYGGGLNQLLQHGIRRVHVVGVDLSLPQESKVLEARRRLSSDSPSLNIDFNVEKGDVTKKLSYPDSYFDAVLSVFTLCSVTDQGPALQEISRVLRPNGGTFSYVEHVAVNPDEESSRPFLGIQQRMLDPLQQVVAGNCHLHRYTENAILSSFGILGEQDGRVSLARRMESDRFFDDSMWPVACQCCGMVQRIVR